MGTAERMIWHAAALVLLAFDCLCGTHAYLGYDIVLAVGNRNIEGFENGTTIAVSERVFVLPPTGTEVVNATEPFPVPTELPLIGPMATFANDYVANLTDTRALLLVFCTSQFSYVYYGGWAADGNYTVFCRNRTAVALAQAGYNRVVGIVMHIGQFDGVLYPGPWSRPAFIAAIGATIANIRAFPGLSSRTPIVFGRVPWLAANPPYKINLADRNNREACEAVGYCTFAELAWNITNYNNLTIYTIPEQRLLGAYYFTLLPNASRVRSKFAAAEPVINITSSPTRSPTASPTVVPTALPSAVPTTVPSRVPSAVPTVEPTPSPTAESGGPTDEVLPLGAVVGASVGIFVGLAGLSIAVFVGVDVCMRGARTLPSL